MIKKAYEPLHHKYRPKCFDELIGQEPITSTLKQALISNRIAPAYIFSGPRGTGKTSSARILAKSLNCTKSENATTKPCGQCELCQTISSGNALDVIEIDAASNTGVENIRELIEKSRFAPVQARWKVYVIDECHMLSTAAFNALLKTLEEPPPQIVFILATTDPQRVLPTILSRCMRFDFRRIGLNDLKNHLEKIALQEKILINEEGLFLIAQHSQGGLRDAESLLDQLSLLPSPIKISAILNLIGAVPEEELIKLATALTSKQPGNILNISRKLTNEGKEPIAILQGLASILRDLIVKKVATDHNNLCNISNENSKKLDDLANSIELDQIISFQAKLKGSEIQIRNSNQPKLWLEVLLLGMLAEENSESVKTQKNNFNNKIQRDSDNEISLREISPNNIKSVQEGILDKTNEEKIDSINENLDLDKTWQKIIAMLELPSTKMLLSQQGKLISLNKDSAEIAISEKWINMIESRKNIIEEAFNKALGSKKKIILIKQKDNTPILKKEETIITNQIKSSSANERNINSQQSIKQNVGETKDNNLKNSDIKSIDNQAKKFADFFNGEVINLE